MKNNYLNNRDILKEIHSSKSSYCSYIDKEAHHQYDLIVKSKDSINRNTISKARAAKISRLERETKEDIDPKTIKKSDLIFRVMTWDHIPLAPPKQNKNQKNKKPSKILDGFNLDELLEIEEDSQDDEEIIVPAVTVVDKTHIKLNFPPFVHYKFDDNNNLVMVGKSHWVGDFETGYFSKTHGRITDTLAHMILQLCERYSTRPNWRNYCVDDQTEALTKRGWLDINQINENDTILSYSESSLAWSRIKSIYRGDFDGLMHRITSRSIDALVTPHHKFVTSRGLIEAELIKQSDQIIVMSDVAAPAPIEKTYSDSFVELVGWIVTEGSYEFDLNKKIKSIRIAQNRGPNADRIRKCLIAENYTFSESNSKCLCFTIWREHCLKFVKTFPTKNLTMDFILKLTADQRELLINTMVDADGWRRKGNNMSYCQKNKDHVDLFQTLLTFAGKKSNYHYVTNHPSFGKLSDYYSINIFNKKSNHLPGACLNFNGGLNNGAGLNRARGKKFFPNFPTTQYKGKVWCPETEFGCFIARRNGKVYLTGNTYNEEMRAQAILQLAQVCLQFDESKSENPFSYFTMVAQNSFTRILNVEKRNQSVRDDLLEKHGLTPSFTRQTKNSHLD